MKKIFLMLVGFLAFTIASAQTDTITHTKKIKTTTKSETKIRDNSTQQPKLNPDGTQRAEKTWEGNTKPNTNAVRINSTGSPDKVTDTIAPPSGTINPERPKSGNTTKSNPNGTVIPPRN